MRIRRLLLFFVCAGLAASLVSLVRPVTPPAVEIALDYTSARRFAVRQGYPLDRLLAAFREAGTTSLLVGDTTLYDLTAAGQIGYPPEYPVRVAVLAGHEARGQALVDRSLDAASFRLDRTYVFVRDNRVLADWLEASLAAAFGRGRVQRVDPGASAANLRIIALATGENQDLLLTPLGVHPPDLETAARHGLAVAVALSQRPLPADGGQGTTLLIRADPGLALANVPPAATLFARGQEVPGYPERVAELAVAIAARGDVLAVHRERAPDREPFPAGLQELLTRSGAQAVKAYTMSYKDRPSDWLAAARERDIRFFVVQAFLLSEDGSQDVDTVTGWVRDLRRNLQASGLTDGPARPRGLGWPHPAAAALMGAGVAAGVLELIRRFRATGVSPVLAALVLAGGAGVAAVSPLPGRQWLALLAAVTFPAVGALSSLAGGPEPRLHPGRAHTARLAGLMAALRLVAWSAAGGLLLHGLLLSPPFWLELNLFRGVKLSLVTPTLLVLAYWAWQRRGAWRADIARLGQREVRFGHLLAGAVVLTVAAFMLVRSAYAGAPVLEFELLLRGALDRWLGVRPRFKEILFGYPLLVVAAYWLQQRLVVPGMAALAAGAVAGASIVNSFAHIHVPAALSAARTLHGAWIGLLAGWLLWAGIRFWQAQRRDADVG